MTDRSRDIHILRDLAQNYAALAAKPIQEERRKLWAELFSLKKTRTPVMVRYGYHNLWCRELFGPTMLQCEDPFYRQHELWLRMQIFHDSIGDDWILEPWITQRAVYKTKRGLFGDLWGAEIHYTRPEIDGGAYKREPFIVEWQDAQELIAPRHEIDEEATARHIERLRAAVGDILEVNVDRGPLLYNFAGDISTTIAALRGMDRLMYDMYDSPQELHALLAFLRDGILANQQEAEIAGDIRLSNHSNQSMPYAEELEWPQANSSPRKRKQLWGFFAAQEYTLISPEFHDRFLFQYQLPIMSEFGLVHYGCCENLTHKIDMLRQLKNLRSIAVTPVADVWKCAEQIGRDYVISWRPNPTDMVCANWDEDRIREVIRDGMEACRNSIAFVQLKDVETVQREPERLARWTQIVRDIVEAY